MQMSGKQRTADIENNREDHATLRKFVIYTHFFIIIIIYINTKRRRKKAILEIKLLFNEIYYLKRRHI